LEQIVDKLIQLIKDVVAQLSVAGFDPQSIRELAYVPCRL
jgi:uncharacterized protein (UPF0335 family)